MKKLMVDMTEPELDEKFRGIARWLENALPGGDGPRGQSFFVLLASGTFAGGIAQYVCNGERASVIQMLRETADRLESRQDIPR